MLNYSKLLQAIQHLDHNHTIAISKEIQDARDYWAILTQNSMLQHCLKLKAITYNLPIWNGDLQKTIFIEANTHEYEAIGIDGSQIYPDRHMGCSYSLINIGSVSIVYTVHNATVSMHNEPYIIQPDFGMKQYAPVEITNARRHEFELSAAIEYEQNNKRAIPRLYLFDGSLIFWHLVSQDQQLIDIFFPRSIALLDQFRQRNMLVAWYISAPKSKELVSLLHQAMQDFPQFFPRSESFTYVRDEALLDATIPPWHTTVLFESNVAIAQLYPTELKPYFCYINIEHEMIRVEMPAWIAKDEHLCNVLLHIVVDQVKKGYGYPVLLAEAHEQAVVKGADRDMFYHVLSKWNLMLNKKNTISQKNSKKRRMSV